MIGGSIDIFKGEDEFHYCNVTDTGYWTVPLMQMKISFADMEIDLKISSEHAILGKILKYFIFIIIDIKKIQERAL